jgi:hypothetical protein
MSRKNDYASLVAQTLHSAESDADRHLAQLGQMLTDMAGGRVGKHAPAWAPTWA